MKVFTAAKLKGSLSFVRYRSFSFKWSKQTTSSTTTKTTTTKDESNIFIYYFQKKEEEEMPDEKKEKTNSKDCTRKKIYLLRKATFFDVSMGISSISI